MALNPGQQDWVIYSKVGGWKINWWQISAGNWVWAVAAFMVGGGQQFCPAIAIGQIIAMRIIELHGINLQRK